MTVTRLWVDVVDGRHRVRMRHGLLRAQQLHGPPDLAHVALVGQTALLLGGDSVEVEIEIGPFARLQLREVAGTVAYDGRGLPARWTTRIRVAAGAHLHWAGEPFVVCDGAAVERATTIELSDSASAWVRETLVFGRSGESGGRLRSRTDVRRAGRPLLTEDLSVDPASRGAPGMLGGNRVLDTICALGLPTAAPAPAGAVRFHLVEPDSSITRYLGQQASDSPLHGERGMLA
jgi:urease accessory protein